MDPSAGSVVLIICQCVWIGALFSLNGAKQTNIELNSQFSAQGVNKTICLKICWWWSTFRISMIKFGREGIKITKYSNNFALGIIRVNKNIYI